jgi:hypothetical protein
VIAARKEEIKFMEDRGIWEVKPIKECWDRTGKAPVSVRWVDTNKGGEWEVVVRSRLVARDFKGKDGDRDDLFAETPPRRYSCPPISPTLALSPSYPSTP